VHSQPMNQPCVEKRRTVENEMHLQADSHPHADHQSHDPSELLVLAAVDPRRFEQRVILQLVNESNLGTCTDQSLFGLVWREFTYDHPSTTMGTSGSDAGVFKSSLLVRPRLFSRRYVVRPWTPILLTLRKIRYADPDGDEGSEQGMLVTSVCTAFGHRTLTQESKMRRDARLLT
jgi:hypothetical protein